MSWNRPSGTPKPQPKKPSAMRGIAAGLVAVAVAAGFFFLFSGDSGKVEIKKTEKKPTRIAEVSPAPAPKAEPETPKEPEPRIRYKPDKDGKVVYHTEKGKKVTITNKYQIAALNTDTPGVQAPHLAPDPSKPRMFKNDLQGELLGFLVPGRNVELSQDYSDKEALEMAQAPIEYGFDDSMQLLEKKKAIEDLCKDLVKFIKDGGHARDYFAALQERQNLECETLRTVKDDVLKYCREGDVETARAALAKYNEYLQTKGFQPLSMEGQMKLAVKRGKRERGEE